ncbi:MAG: hypothetical protein ABSD53_13685 [Terriglobales bacterium]|jgi:hypothetical protein
MLRLIATSLFACVLTVSGLAQVAQAQSSDAQPNVQNEGTAPNEQKTVDPVPTAGPVRNGYPLDAFTDFSAIMTGSFVLDDPTELHIYRSKNLMRVEGSEGVGYYLTDLKAQSAVHVWDDGCAADKHVYVRSSPWAAAARPGYRVQTATGGKETMDGHACQIEDVTITGPELQKPLKLRLWEAEDLKGFPIRIDSVRANGHNRTLRYKNVVLGPQDRTLFLRPKSCQPPVGGDRKSVVVAPKAKAHSATPPPSDPQK